MPLLASMPVRILVHMLFSRHGLDLSAAVTFGDWRMMELVGTYIASLVDILSGTSGLHSLYARGSPTLHGTLGGRFSFPECPTL
jgi:hypothetical protein